MRWPFSCKEIRMHRVHTLRGVISGEKPRHLLRSMPSTFTVRDISVGMVFMTPPEMDAEAPLLAQEALRQWYEAGRITQAGTVDSQPAWRRAA